MKYLVLFLLIVNMNCFGQDYQSEIAQFRKDYIKNLTTDKNSPLKAEDVHFLRFYAPDSNYRVTAKVRFVINSQTLLIPFLGKTAGREYLPYAVLTFAINDKQMELTVYQSVARPNSNYLFLPFLDETNNSETYGGGRYIDLQKIDIQNGVVIIDFNKAYNPYCAFSANYSCPKPPDGNSLAIAIKAGEKRFEKDNH